jgi:hypothetical protein
LRAADVTLGTETVGSMAIQVIGDPAFMDIPESCSNSGVVSVNTIMDLGANGILGVGPLPEDCGGMCADSVTDPASDNPGNVYFTCPPSGCKPASVAVEDQVQNPVSLLSVDNNGVVIDLSGVPMSGAPIVGGSLIFGIGTAPNNALENVTILSLDPSTLSLTTSYLGQAYPMSIIDSGSNAIYFLDSATTGIAPCTNPSTTGFYCPQGAGAQNLTAIQQGTNGAVSSVSFSIVNADILYANEQNVAFDDIAGPSVGGEYFDWGLPFFFGRRIYSAIEGSTAPGGQTPYVAY